MIKQLKKKINWNFFFYLVKAKTLVLKYYYDGYDPNNHVKDSNDHVNDPNNHVNDPNDHVNDLIN